MKAADIHEFFREVGTWMDWSQTVDGPRFGDPDAEVTGVAVAWKPHWSDLKRAKELGCNLSAAHESVFREGPMRPRDGVRVRPGALMLCNHGRRGDAS